MILDLIVSMRPRQWVKNAFVLAALIFSKHLFEWPYLLPTLIAVGCFLAVSCAVYLLNDILDVERDRLHPQKSSRPLAAGRIPVTVATIVSILLFAAGIGASYAASPRFGHIVALYCVLNVIYSGWLKRFVLIDVLIVAFGFLLRAMGGAVVIDVHISTWFILCSFTLALFLATVKRRQELVKLDDGARNHRESLEQYSVAYLDQVISVLTSATLVCYALYAMGVGEDGANLNRDMQWTIPFVLYGILRYLYVVYRQQGGENPTVVIWNDRPLQVTVLLWVLTSVLILSVL
jgi:4-hydroxybenzoate polyprenyltransferase